MRTYPESSARFDLGEAIMLLIFIAGGYVDGYAHNHFDSIESFFTPWHAILYGGFALSALYVLIPAFRNRRAGYDWAHCLPEGYDITLWGIALFAVAGFCDMIWHIVFGIEANIDALMSPPHILLFAATLMMAGGPVRSIVRRNDPDRTSWNKNAAFVLVMLFFFMEFGFLMMAWPVTGNGDVSPTFSNTGTFWTQHVRDIEAPAASGGSADLGGIHALDRVEASAGKEEKTTKFTDSLLRMGAASIMIFAAMLSGILLYVVKVGRVPVGSFTLLVFVSTAAESLMRELSLPSSFMIPQIVLGLVAGVAIDLLYLWLKPTFNEKRNLYTFAFAAPAVFMVLYFITRTLAGGVWWSGHLIAGSCIYAGGIGLLLAILASRNEFA